jgi:hypothetical protein
VVDEGARAHVLGQVTDVARAGDRQHVRSAAQRPGDTNLGGERRVKPGKSVDRVVEGYAAAFPANAG